MDKDVWAALLDRIRGEYREMPGLQLTLAQASRLWQLDEPTCRTALKQLVQDAFLRQTSNGGYVALPERGEPLKAHLDQAVFVRRA
jgi:hypothetical protein